MDSWQIKAKEMSSSPPKLSWKDRLRYRNLRLCFIDYSKVFDKVRHSDLFDILSRLSFDGIDLRVLRNLYWVQEAVIRVDNDCSEYRPICRGVRQGCVFSPDLFNINSEVILRNIEKP